MTEKKNNKTHEELKAPFPYFGGKSRIADKVWERFGNVETYVEPFGGSLAVLLARPTVHEWWKGKETVGDYSGHIVNFYRAVKYAPKEVAEYANWPVTEADLTARHLWLVRYQNELAEKLAADPEYYESKTAGWWVWGISSWVGGEWCSGLGPWKPGEEGNKTALGVYRKMPMSAGNHSGKGIHKLIKRNPYFDEEGLPLVEELHYEELEKTFNSISNRLRRVRIVCGDWKRMTKSISIPPKGKVAGIFLDPPYDLSSRRGDLYGPSDARNNQDVSLAQVHEEARSWALQLGVQENFRVAYCSYFSETENSLFLNAGWTSLNWQAAGGYGLQANNLAKENRDKEIIWFSPHCLDPQNNAALIQTADTFNGG